MREQLELGLHAVDPQVGDVERALARTGATRVIGCDEAGRGPLAGPVTVAAVLLDPRDVSWCDGLTDSKQLSPEQRAAWVPRVQAHALLWEVRHVAPEVIDEKNILWASLEGMGEAAAALVAAGARPDAVLVDGNRPMPKGPGPQTCLVKGDARSYAIAAASVLAKEARDARMRELDLRYPLYGFAQHKGYPTRQHLQALVEHGPCPAHRWSYRPVAAAYEAQASNAPR